MSTRSERRARSRHRLTADERQQLDEAMARNRITVHGRKAAAVIAFTTLLMARRKDRVRPCPASGR